MPSIPPKNKVLFRKTAFHAAVWTASFLFWPPPSLLPQTTLAPEQISVPVFPAGESGEEDNHDHEGGLHIGPVPGIRDSLSFLMDEGGPLQNPNENLGQHTGLDPLLFTEPDTSAPVIKSKGTWKITETSVVILWNTSESADGKVEFWNGTGWVLKASHSGRVLWHSVAVSGLDAGTSYTVRVRSKDASGNETVSSSFSFKTRPSTAAVPVPVILARNTWNIQDTSAVVLWSTNEPADAAVEIFDGTAWVVNAKRSTRVKAHSVKITGLEPDTRYQVRVRSKNAQGGEVISEPFTIKTKASDLTPPAVSGVFAAEIDSDSARIEWTSNEVSSFRLEYGTDLSYGGSISMDDFVTGRSVLIDGLRPEVTYHYRVISRDRAGNESVSSGFTFRTKPFYGLSNDAVLFLDFDGTFLSTWGGFGNVTVPVFDKDGNPGSFSASEITLMEQVLSAVTEKFSVFNIGVTLADPFAPFDIYTDPAQKFEARNAFYESNRILQIAVGGSSSGVLGIAAAGGAAYVDSFTNVYENTALVFSDNLSKAARYIWEAAAHEAGHGFGAWHQSAYNSGGAKTAEYNPGANGVAPIMGNSYDKRGLWWYGPTTSVSRLKNDMSVITQGENEISLRGDEQGGSIDTAASFPEVFGTAFGAYGVIHHVEDADYFRFTLTETGDVSFAASPAQYGAMLDLKLKLLDSEGNLLAEENTSSLGETIGAAALAPGAYYLAVESRYQYIGDVGQYWIDGRVPPGTTTP